MDMKTVEKKTGKQDTKAALIQAGMEFILEKGFNNTGIDMILKSVGVPKGSFYYYFSSKDDFGLSILNTAAESYQKRLDGYFKDSSLTPLNRIRKYFEDGVQNIESCGCKKGCLFGNLGQEMADQNEAFRTRLEEIFQDWTDRLAACFKEAKELGEIPEHLCYRELAEFCLFSWEGAVLRAKVTKNSEPVKLFVEVLFNEILKK
jgi:TetR/AcrR family transcriptional regulator, transcriptional repressor for nem operon